MKKILIPLILNNDAYARGGHGGDGGGIILGLIGVIIAFFLCELVGKALSPYSKSTDQIIIGLFVILFCLALLLRIFK
jgi:hypothetical protein